MEVALQAWPVAYATTTFANAQVWFESVRRRMVERCSREARIAFLASTELLRCVGESCGVVGCCTRLGWACAVVVVGPDQ